MNIQACTDNADYEVGRRVLQSFSLGSERTLQKCSARNRTRPARIFQTEEYDILESVNDIEILRRVRPSTPEGSTRCSLVTL